MINENDQAGHKKAVIVLNGEVKDREYYRKIIQNKNLDLFLAADGGARVFLEFEACPDFVIGDLDSLKQQEIETLQKKGCEIISYPQEKDETDAELCLQFCNDNGIQEAILLSSLGGRIDQQLANIFLLEYAAHLDIDCKIIEPSVEIGLIENSVIFSEKQGWFLSLLPIDQQIRNVTIEGCKYNANNLNMKRFLTRGISNRITASGAKINVKEGKLLYILRKGE